MRSYLMKGKLLVISGLSAAGKGTIVKALLEKHDDYALSISATTRERRGSEVDGVDYFFISRDRFLQMIEEKAFLEYAEYVGNFYGTPRQYVEDKIDKGINVILEIEMQGALQVKKIYNDAILIFILPKSAKAQRERFAIRNRDSSEQVEKRIKQTLVDAEFAKEYDYVLINDKLDDSIRYVEDIVSGNYDKSNNKLALETLDEIVRDIKEEQNV